MIINSPVGRFPFDATSVSISGGRVRLEGSMGTWPTSIDVPIAEVPHIVARLLPRGTPAGVAGAAVLLAALTGYRRRRRFDP